MKVLLIEDDPIFQEMYKDEFTKSGIEFIVASEGKEGIIKAAKQKPDFILLDIMMGGLDGVSTLRHLKELKETSDIPVAFLTVVPENVPQTLHHDPKILEGAVGFWTKDKYTPAQIVEMVRKHLLPH